MGLEDGHEGSQRSESASHDSIVGSDAASSCAESPTNDTTTNYGTSPATSGSSKNRLLSGPTKEASNNFQLATSLFSPDDRKMGNPIWNDSGNARNSQYVLSAGPQITPSRGQLPRVYQGANTQDILTQCNLIFPSPRPDIPAWLNKVSSLRTTKPEDPFSKPAEAKDESKEPQTEKQSPAGRPASAHEQNSSVKEDSEDATDDLDDSYLS